MPVFFDGCPVLIFSARGCKAGPDQNRYHIPMEHDRLQNLLAQASGNVNANDNIAT